MHCFRFIEHWTRKKSVAHRFLFIPFERSLTLIFFQVKMESILFLLHTFITSLRYLRYRINKKYFEQKYVQFGRKLPIKSIFFFTCSDMSH